MVGCATSLWARLLLHSSHWYHNGNHQPATKIECDYGVHNGVHLPRATSSKHVLQGVWIHQYDTGLYISARLQVGPLHEDTTKNNVHGSAVVYLGTAWWLMDSIPNICNTKLLSSDSPWTCPGDHVFYDASVIWGLIGPRRIFGDLGSYSAINWFFLVGVIAPLLVWLATKAFPEQPWIRLINMPVMIGATGMMPPATAVN